jgi:hypothetical protein
MKRTLIGIEKLEKDLRNCGWGEMETTSIINALRKDSKIELITEEEANRRFFAKWEAVTE